MTGIFAKKKVNVERVKKYVEDKTPFIATHMRSALKLLEDEGRLKVNELKQDGKKRRKGTYPDTAMLDSRECLIGSPLARTIVLR